MKQLYLIRHGKATHELMPDIKRYLTEKGIKRIEKHASILTHKNIKPDLIISSPAVRAFQTAEILAKNINFPIEKIEINPKLYFYPEKELKIQIQKIPNQFNSVFLIGHNPVWTDLADQLSENGLWHLRTGGILGVKFNTDTWNNVFQVRRKDIILIN